MTTLNDVECAALDQITLHMMLDTLPIMEREMVEMCYAIACPDWYEDRWPATLTDIGYYVGMRYTDAPLCAMAVCRRVRATLGTLRAAVTPSPRADETVLDTTISLVECAA